MILIFETGNTTTNIVLRDDNEIKFAHKIPDTFIKTENDLENILNNLLELNNFKVEDIEIALISSVVRKIEEIEENYCKTNKIKSINIKNENIKLNFKKREKTGSDIVANVFNCIDLYKNNFLLIDMGTATTFSVIDKNNEFIGRSFISGVRTILDSLSLKCDLLPIIKEIEKPTSVFGGDTESCMQSGLYYGYIGILKEITRRVKEELNSEDLEVIITGGYSHMFIDELDFVTQFIPNLTIDGIYKIYKFNKDNINKCFQN